MRWTWGLRARCVRGSLRGGQSAASPPASRSVYAFLHGVSRNIFFSERKTNSTVRLTSERPEFFVCHSDLRVNMAASPTWLVEQKIHSDHIFFSSFCLQVCVCPCDRVRLRRSITAWCAVLYNVCLCAYTVVLILPASRPLGVPFHAVCVPLLLVLILHYGAEWGEV